MRATATIASWLPWLKDFLPQLILLEEKAAELYHFSLLGKALVSSTQTQTVFGIEKASGGLAKILHRHLTRKGFLKRNISGEREFSDTLYFRGDLGYLRFVFPQVKPRQKATRSGLAAQPSRKAQLLLENPHAVEVKYLNASYEVFIPQVGRFILAEGLELKTGSRNNSGKIFESAKSLALIMDLLVQNEDLQKEALNDFLEIRPPVLLREFQENLRQHGPGSILWESAQKLFGQSHPETPGVVLSTWYWKFFPILSKTLVSLREEV
jgi:hypothetical protein